MSASDQIAIGGGRFTMFTSLPGRTSTGWFLTIAAIFPPYYNSMASTQTNKDEVGMHNLSITAFDL
jgi:hypothetical protein